ERRVRQLRPAQRFNVIFFADPDRKPRCAWKLCNPADDAHKATAIQFLNTVTAAGSTDPFPAIEFALKQNPRLVVLMTDGDFPDSEKLMKQLKDLNRGRQVTFSTVAFINARDIGRDGSFAAGLKQIAKDHNGTFEQISVQPSPQH